MLECALWGCRTPDALAWVDAPGNSAWEAAAELLRELGALDRQGAPTERGRAMASLGLHPRLAALVLAGVERGFASLACAAAAALADRDGSRVEGDADFRRRLAILRGDESALSSPSDRTSAAAWRSRTREAQADLARRVGLDDAPAALGFSAADEGEIGSLLAIAFPDRIALLQEDAEAPTGKTGKAPSARFRFPSGREARLDGPLGRERWIVAAEADAGERAGYIRLAAPLDPSSALAALEPFSAEDRRVEWNGLVPRTVTVRSAGKIVLSETRRKSTAAEAEEALPALLAERGIAALPWDEEGGTPGRLLERIRFFAARAENSEEMAPWDDETLAGESSRWLGPYLLSPREGGPVLSGGGLASALSGRLGWDRLEQLRSRVPETFSPPRGRPRRIDYSTGEPVVRVRVQDVFGLSENPAVLGVPIVFHLLSPADRPLQITRDIAGFWTGSYVEIRKEMRGRYPKHEW